MIKKRDLMSNKGITILTNWIIRGGGTEKNTIKIANYLAENEIKINLLVMTKLNNDLETDISDKITVKYLSNKNISLNTYFLLIKYLVRHKPNKVFASNHRLAIILLILRSIIFCNFKISSRCIVNLSILFEKKNFIVKHLFSLMFRKVDCVIAQCEGMKNDLIGNWKISKDNVYVIYNPVATQKNISAFRNKNNIIPKIIFIGRLRPQKAVHYQLHALNIIKKKGIKFKFYIIGEGYLRENLEKDTYTLGLADDISFEGYQKNLEKYYQMADLILLTSIYEGFPNVLIEAMAYGVPAVSFKTPFGPEEIICDGINGFLSEYKNIHDFTNKLLHAIEYKWDKNKIIESTFKFKDEFVMPSYINILSK
jgi:glycosyltransferase involved in cell wall biosynthesis